MRMQLVRVAVAVGLGFALPALVSAQHWAAGQWIGGFESREGTTYVSVAFSEEAAGLAGVIDLPLRGDTDLPLDRVRANDRSLSFEIRGARSTLLFDGRKREDGRVSGSVRQDFASVSFELLKVATLTAERLDAIAGNYELEPGHVVLIARSQHGLIYLDQDTGRLGSLFPLDDRTLVAGPTIGSGYPVELTVTLPQSGAAADGLLWERRGRAPVTGTRRTFYRTEQVGYYNGSLRLSATIVLPNAPGPHPGIVMVHGSGRPRVTRCVRGPMSTPAPALPCSSATSAGPAPRWGAGRRPPSTISRAMRWRAWPTCRAGPRSIRDRSACMA